ncbi:hypothetical protein [Dactylosporangium darangshiense]|uniref:Intracellular proteinase inhibitor BsuPI domain-containing protein n=1 Tax=Dactylosporangium darangshiense TaxID=579108 RepID=A0ABP8CTY8_9ACTN
MKLTVGPLPAGTYWRRRAIVGGVVLVATLLLWTSCGGSDPADEQRTRMAASAGAPTSAAAAPSTTFQRPIVGDASTSSAPPLAVTSSAAASNTSTVPPCADADLSLVAVADQVMQVRGVALRFRLKIKNITNHDCSRDTGADMQELYLQAGTEKMWSSDACNAPKGSEMSILKPNIEVSFENTWDGKVSKNGCSNRTAPPAGKYELVARLDTKISSPVQIQLT